jgi:hypothetical protein
MLEPELARGSAFMCYTAPSVQPLVCIMEQFNSAHKKVVRVRAGQ